MLSKDEMEKEINTKLTQTIQTSEICITKTPKGVLVLEQFFQTIFNDDWIFVILGIQNQAESTLNFNF